MDYLIQHVNGWSCQFLGRLVIFSRIKVNNNHVGDDGEANRSVDVFIMGLV